MKQSRKMKMVFTLKSGKSIVVSMLEEQCFNVYNQWVKFVPETSTVDVSKINLDKKRENMIVETIGILLEEIAAIQIVENHYEKINNNE